MPQSVSQSSLISNVSPIDLENAEIVLRDEFEDTVLDVEEYTCTNREVVNLENAAVNIDNSNDVIIGPVTQFNVNGNVTIFQNGTREQEVPNGAITNKEEEEESNNISRDDAKLGKVGKTESGDLDLKKLDKSTKYIKIFLSISFALTVIVGIIFTIVFYTQKTAEPNIPPNESGDGQFLGSHQILDKSQWNGRAPKSVKKMLTPVSLVVIKHTGGGPCSSFLECAGKLQTIQSRAVSKGASDIYYNFLIGGDGNIYVGRGWDVQPEQRDNMTDIAFMGSFTFDVPTPTMIEAAQFLIAHGVKNSKLTEDYKVVCHNQTIATESPGLNLINEVKRWPHYDSGLYFGDTLTNIATPKS